MDADVLEKYREAGRVLAAVLKEAAPKVEVGVSLLEVAEFVEDSIRSKGALPAFPCNISLDKQLHYRPLPRCSRL
jgi:methionyl aminopeptidase